MKLSQGKIRNGKKERKSGVKNCEKKCQSIEKGKNLCYCFLGRKKSQIRKELYFVEREGRRAEYGLSCIEICMVR